MPRKAFVGKPRGAGGSLCFSLSLHPSCYCCLVGSLFGLSFPFLSHHVCLCVSPLSARLSSACFFGPRVFPVLVFLPLSFSWGCPAIGGVIKAVPVGPDAPTLRASPEAWARSSMGLAVWVGSGGLFQQPHIRKCPPGLSGVGRESVSVWICRGVQTAGAWSASS